MLYYRTTPHSVTHVSPSVSFNGRKLICARDKIHPKYCSDSRNNVSLRQIAQYNVGDEVLALNVPNGPKWYNATVLEKLGINVYNVYVDELEIVWKRHKSQLLFISASRNRDISNKSNDIINEADTPTSRSLRIRKPPDRLNY